jgi:hypothetical protein
MPSSERAEATASTPASSASTSTSAASTSTRTDAGGPGLSGPASATEAIEQITVSCLANAQYHACREAFLDSIHRWFMFLVIALGAAALMDALPHFINWLSGLAIEPAAVKEMCAAGAAILAALDLTFDLSNRARNHAMMKRRYFELLADLRDGPKTPEHVKVCVERYSADEEPQFRVLFLICWNAAQETVYGPKRLRYNIGLFSNLFKNCWRRPAADFRVVDGRVSAEVV